MTWVKVMSASQLPAAGMVHIALEDDDLALYHVDGEVYATSDICTHAGESLATGTLSGCVVQCPKHGGKFDVRTGAAVAFPCVVPVATFPVEIRDGDVYVDVEL